jgi:ribosome maturation factor RimP
MLSIDVKWAWVPTFFMLEWSVGLVQARCHGPAGSFCMRPGFLSLQKSIISNKLEDMKNEDLEEILTPELEALGYECIKCEVAGSGRNKIIRLYIDRPVGVSIKDCAAVSRAMGLVLDQLDPFPGRYLLEVSSPGNNRPLTRENHFVTYTGHTARVQWADPEEGKKTYTGTIRSCINGILVLESSEGEQHIQLSRIIKSNLTDEIYKIDKKMKHTKRKKGGTR